MVSPEYTGGAHSPQEDNMTTQDARSEIARQIENDFDVFYLSGSDLEDFQT